MSWLTKSARAVIADAKRLSEVVEKLDQNAHALCASLLRQLEALEAALDAHHAANSSEANSAPNENRLTIDG